MKAHNLKYTVAFFLLLSPFGMFAQQQMATDSISIFELMDAVAVSYTHLRAHET